MAGGSGMITEVAGRILAEFERNLSVMLTQGLAARRSSQLLATSGRARRRMREGVAARGHGARV